MFSTKKNRLMETLTWKKTGNKNGKHVKTVEKNSEKREKTSQLLAFSAGFQLKNQQLHPSPKALGPVFFGL